MEPDARHSFVRRLQDQLRKAAAETEAHRDPLTGLFNRPQLDRESERLWTQANSGTAITAIVCDIDHFKAYNDRYGHPTGDLCLKRAATAIAEELRDGNDMAVRIGGEEFLILLPDANAMLALRLAERVRLAIEALAMPHEGQRSRDRNSKLRSYGWSGGVSQFDGTDRRS